MPLMRPTWKLTLSLTVQTRACSPGGRNQLRGQRPARQGVWRNSFEQGTFITVDQRVRISHEDGNLAARFRYRAREQYFCRGLCPYCPASLFHAGTAHFAALCRIASGLGALSATGGGYTGYLFDRGSPGTARFCSWPGVLRWHGPLAWAPRRVPAW